MKHSVLMKAKSHHQLLLLISHINDSIKFGLNTLVGYIYPKKTNIQLNISFENRAKSKWICIGIEYGVFFVLYILIWDTNDNNILQMVQLLHLKVQLTSNEESPPSICDMTKGNDPCQVTGDSAPSMVLAILPQGCLVFVPFQNMSGS